MRNESEMARWGEGLSQESFNKLSEDQRPFFDRVVTDLESVNVEELRRKIRNELS